MSTLEINLDNKLKAKIGEVEARESIDFRSEDKRVNSDRILATEQDINDVRLKIKEAKTDMIK